MPRAIISMSITRRILRTSTRIIPVEKTPRPITMNHNPGVTRILTKWIFHTFLFVVLPIAPVV